MNYYEQLYDINFFYRDKYVTQVGKSKIEIIPPGMPDWKTWKSSSINASKAKELYDDFYDKIPQYEQTLLFQKRVPEEVFSLLILILIEEAYRSFDLDTFFILNRILYTSNLDDIKLKSVKLQHAVQALIKIVGNNKPLKKIEEMALTYLNDMRPDNKYTLEDIKVEKPVAKDWNKQKCSFDDINSVEKFYKETDSYILELTAANHQVETLFNYNLVIETLKKLGVEHVFDYGAGIGTFLILAYKNNMRITYADLPSHTMGYSRYRFHQLNIPAVFIELEWDKYEVPNGVECIVCTEVLEHIYKPEKLIRKFYDALSLGGIIVVSESFNYTEEFCTHIPFHRGKGDHEFLKFMDRTGFHLLDLGYVIHPLIFIKY